MKRKFIIIDNGHGIETRGKCSPDGRLREWQWTRQIARMLAGELTRRGIGSHLLVPGDGDVALAERVRMVNALCRTEEGSVLVSLHSNASGMGDAWGKASGWCAFVAPNAGAVSRRLAVLLTRRAFAAGLAGNRSLPPDSYYESNLAVCTRTRCPAVLTENMFHDNPTDVEYMLSPEGQKTIVDIHAGALEELEL